MSFIQQMQTVAQDKKAANDALFKSEQERQVAFKKQQDQIKHERFQFLTTKYYWDLRNSIEHASKQGKREKYINFDRNDFKANFPGLGTPIEFQNAWLEELSDPDSQYILVNTLTEQKDHFQGLEWDIWNNGAFTTHFTW